MIVYHATAHAEKILTEGFRSSPRWREPVAWVSAVALGGMVGPQTIELTIPDELFFRHRGRFLVDATDFPQSMSSADAAIPIDEINQHLSTARILTPDELADVIEARR